MTDKKPVGRPPERIKVEVRRRDEIEDVLWPKGWPLPESGMVFLGEVVSGWVEHIELNLPAQRVIVILRP